MNVEGLNDKEVNRLLQCVAVSCSELQCAAVCCSVLQCVAVCCVCCIVLQCVELKRLDYKMIKMWVLSCT